MALIRQNALRDQAPLTRMQMWHSGSRAMRTSDEIEVLPLVRTGAVGETQRGELSVSDLGTFDAVVGRLTDGALSQLELTAGMRIDEFEVRSLIAQGGLGRVYLARDLRLGRLAAIKVIRPDRLRADRLRRFVDEARITASFNHPNIVVVYALGSIQGSLYLAMEYLDGEGLDARITSGPLGPREALRIARDVARALEEAHQHGVVHRDVKPSNVVMPRDGRPRVVDFGLAVRVVDTGDGLIVGTPGYLAPEVWRGVEATAAADMFSFGVVLAEMLLGAHPYRAATTAEAARRAATVSATIQLPDVPPAVAELVRACLSAAPSDRPSASDVVGQLDRILDGALDHDDESPFRGLMPFDERHSADFFGRDDEVAGFLELARRRPALLVVGSSGAGKSSFVFAGVMPRLRDRGRTRVLAMRPGEAPFEALAYALLHETSDGSAAGASVSGPRGDVEALTEELAATPWALNLHLHTLASRLKCRVVLVIDQLEEVVTHDRGAGLAARFVDALARAAVEPDGPVLVIATARDDFLGRLALGPAIARVLEHVTVLSKPPEASLRAIITAPLARKRYTFDDEAMVDAMVADVRGTSAALPLLQFVCQALWERRDRTERRLLRAAYDALGGVAGALSQYADARLEQLSPEALRDAKQLCLRLVGGDGTRKAVLRRDVLAGLGDGAVDVLGALTRARLLTARREAGGDEPVIELSHDCLVTTWGVLKRWRLEHDQDLAFTADLDAAATVWERQGARADRVWTGEALAEAQGRLRRLAIRPSPRAVAFIDAGARREARGRRRRHLVLGALAATLVAITAGAVYVAARFRAQAERIDLARADIGRFIIELEPFDWDPEALAARPPPVRPPLVLAVFAEDRARPGEPGAPVDPSILTIEPIIDGGTGGVGTGDDGTGDAYGPDGVARLRVATRGGPAFIRISNRGGDCGPVWIHAASLPGYPERDTQVFRVPVPTCAATLAGTIMVPEGPYISSGPGDPPTTRAEFVQPETVATLPAFRIDRTELPNALLAQFATLAELTGIAAATVPADFDGSGRDRPVTGLDAYQSEAVCRYLGRRLPTTKEWEKAARGGLTLADGTPNPIPRRNYAWGTAPPGASWDNFSGAADGYPYMAPVGAFAQGASPYGVVGLMGNVAEWTATPADPTAPLGNRFVRGESWATEASDGHVTIAYENSRAPKYFDFSLGFRCAVSGP